MPAPARMGRQGARIGRSKEEEKEAGAAAAAENVETEAGRAREKASHEGSRLGQEGPRLGQEGPRISQQGPSISQQGARLGPSKGAEKERPDWRWLLEFIKGDGGLRIGTWAVLRAWLRGEGGRSLSMLICSLAWRTLYFFCFFF